MVLWEFIVICGIIFVLCELFIPSMFFLNFALAAFITAFASLYISRMLILVLIFFVFSFLSFAFLRPLLIKRKDKAVETGVSDKYIGKTAKVIEDVSDEKGAITIYDERWNSRCESGLVIPAGTEVRIIKNDGLIMFVEKISK